jgi:hypothetical protein
VAGGISQKLGQNIREPDRTKVPLAGFTFLAALYFDLLLFQQVNLARKSAKDQAAGF